MNSTTQDVAGIAGATGSVNGSSASTARPAWPLERVLFSMAGSFTLGSAILAATASKWFLLLTGLVGINQLLYVATGRCPASVILRRSCHLQSSIYPNPEPQAAGTDGT